MPSWALASPISPSKPKEEALQAKGPAKPGLFVRFLLFLAWFLRLDKEGWDDVVGVHFPVEIEGVREAGPGGETPLDVSIDLDGQRWRHRGYRRSQ